MRYVLVVAALSLGGCAVFGHPTWQREEAPATKTARAKRTAPRPRPTDDEEGFVTYAATPDTAPYGADPFKSTGRGAPPR